MSTRVAPLLSSLGLLGLVGLLVSTVTGCGDDDAAVRDGGNVDLGARDLGPDFDGGPPHDGGPTPDGGPPPAACARPLFPADAPWNQDISAAPVDGESAAVIANLDSLGWGLGHMQIDFSFHVQCATGAPLRTFTPTGDFYDGDCDVAQVPVPVGGHLEGETGYECTVGGDCHLIVIDPGTQRLYEQWRVNIVSDVYEGGCLAVWDLSSTPPPTGRGERCTSADAAGLPITALLFDADEVAADDIRHAIRLILPNDRIREDIYVHPATHGTGAPNGGSGGNDTPPYGARLRLRADYPLASLPNEYARAVAHAMMRYGLVLSDGGNVALTAEDDENTTAKWDFLTDDRTAATGLGPGDLDLLQPGDFVMIEGGTRFNWRDAPGCVRTP
jgi:serine/threonine-protein kinase